MIGSIGENSTRREFLKRAAVGGAVALIAPAAHGTFASTKRQTAADDGPDAGTSMPPIPPE
jgi:anaerobic selenocysteine-containing dehydrogenase